MTFDQSDFTIRCEWGANGVAALAAISDAIIIVDVFSFSTAVTIATGRGAVVYPYKDAYENVAAYAGGLGAELAGKRGEGRYSLSPNSLLTIPAGTRLVLPSPNGATLSLATGDTPTYAGCLRNARAVAQAAAGHGEKIAVIPCGERWWGDYSLRPGIEDFIGAGAIIHFLPGGKSPEAGTAEAAFLHAREDLPAILGNCSSGKELIAKGSGADIQHVAQLNVDNHVPFLKDGAYHAQ